MDRFATDPTGTETEQLRNNLPLQNNNQNNIPVGQREAAKKKQLDSERGPQPRLSTTGMRGHMRQLLEGL